MIGRGQDHASVALLRFPGTTDHLAHHGGYPRYCVVVGGILGTSYLQKLKTADPFISRCAKRGSEQVNL
jgi:hypothetical protein